MTITPGGGGGGVNIGGALGACAAPYKRFKRGSYTSKIVQFYLMFTNPFVSGYVAELMDPLYPRHKGSNVVECLQYVREIESK